MITSLAQKIYREYSVFHKDILGPIKFDFVHKSNKIFGHVDSIL